MAKALVRMPDELHRALKMEAAKRGVSMQELVQTAVGRILSGASEPASVATEGARKVQAAPHLADLTAEEFELSSALVAFLRAEKGSARAAGLRVMRAVLEEHLQHRRPQRQVK